MRKQVNIKIGDLNPPQMFNTEFDLSVGDVVIVESPNGAEWGTVSSEPKEARGKHGQLNMVIRVADDNDMKTITDLRAAAKNAIKVAEEQIDKHKLDMKPLEAYYTLDGNKVIIMFSAPGRVDFRELVRNLAYALRARIELKQIGQREEVKLKGALGPCGQVCCCVRFREEGNNINIKMAKNQNLSLNPHKINGMCGRLLCCLSYENQHYADMQDKMPRWGQEVETPDGRGIAQDSHLLKETVNVKFQKGDQTRTACYKLCQIKCKGGKGGGCGGRCATDGCRGGGKCCKTR